jgi:ClpX C4-type zinc finger
MAAAACCCCGRDVDQVTHLNQGPGLFICDICVDATDAIGALPIARSTDSFGSESLCVRVFRVLRQPGVWDATIIFPYGGARIIGLVRQ